MLNINRLKIVIKTVEKNYIFDEHFKKGLNFIASRNNTCGKSSILAAIYYCLGFEEILGGRGEKVLTSVYKSAIQDADEVIPVLESEMYLEISNGSETIVIYRTGKNENRDNRLITVYFDTIDNMFLPEVGTEDMYVHMPYAATNKRGFHTFLEDFLQLSLPYIPSYDDSERKLYLQLIFSSMFIEQKQGWGDILAGMPNLGIKESKKRIIEYILNLDTLENEKKKLNLILTENILKGEWKQNKDLLFDILKRYNCICEGVPVNPQILDDDFTDKVKIRYANEMILNIYIQQLKKELSEIVILNPKVGDNYDAINQELEEIEFEIESYESIIAELRYQLLAEGSSIDKLKDNLDKINIDLMNNKDAAKLQKLGADVGCLLSTGVCPTCNQKISDNLMPQNSETKVMSIDENIKHLNEQRLMLEYAFKSHEENRKNIDSNIQIARNKIATMRRLASSLRNDLYTIDDGVSESLIQKKVELQRSIEEYEQLKIDIDDKLKFLFEISIKWKKYIADKNEFSKDKFSELDLAKLRYLENCFKSNLSKYGYRSVDTRLIKISQETYLPTIDNFDMKFDSSASDNIRAIWAFTMALMMTSSEYGGNCQNILIFDEPDQHSIIVPNMEEFFKSIISFNKSYQVIIGITIKDTETNEAIMRIPEDKFHLIEIKDKAFI
jgi:predicted  nucleic acid-binding Zn-ribbon protein